jgi:hypothetical protein
MPGGLTIAVSPMARLARSALLLLSSVAFAAGLGLLALGAALAPLAEARRARDDGRLDRALAQYTLAAQRLAPFATVHRSLGQLHDRARAGRLAMLYRLGRYDALLEAAAAGPPTAETRFWSGCAYFQKAEAERQADSRLDWLARAEEAFRGALELDPNLWDAKVDYELTRRLQERLRNDPTLRPTQLMPLLRPQPRTAPPTGRRTG